MAKNNNLPLSRAPPQHPKGLLVDVSGTNRAVVEWEPQRELVWNMPIWVWGGLVILREIGPLSKTFKKTGYNHKYEEKEDRSDGGEGQSRREPNGDS